MHLVGFERVLAMNDPDVVLRIDGKVPAGVDVVGIATQTSSDQPNYPPSSWLALPLPTR